MGTWNIRASLTTSGLKTRLAGANILGILWLLVFTIFAAEWIRRSQPLKLETYWVIGIYAVIAIIVLSLRRRVLGLSWIALGGILIGLWLLNHRGEPRTTLLLEFLVACAVFFTLEGMELAYTELRDKDPEQLPPPIANAIQEINEDRDAFYDAREFIIVLLLAWLTVSSDFAPERFEVPNFHLSPSREWTLAFSLVFTSTLVIWFAQSPSKRIATTNSLAFLSVFQFAFVWRYCLKPIGTVMRSLQMTYPGHLLAKRLERLRSFRNERNLPPSRRSFYLDALKCYGYGYPVVQDKVVVHGDTSAQFHHTSLVYFTDTAPRSEFSAKFEFDSDVLSAQSTLRTFAVPLVGEQLKPGFEAGLHAIFTGGPLPDGLTERKCSLRTEGEIKNKSVTFRIHSPDPLPTSVTGVAGGMAAVVFLDFTIDVDKYGFKLPSGSAYSDRVKDYWEKRNVSPCGEYSFLLEIEPSAQKLKVANFVSHVKVWEGEHQEEFRRVNKPQTTAPALTRAKTIAHPLLGATYRFEWEVWPN